jgi:hypothetical protein
VICALLSYGSRWHRERDPTPAEPQLTWNGEWHRKIYPELYRQSFLLHDTTHGLTPLLRNVVLILEWNLSRYSSAVPDIHYYASIIFCHYGHSIDPKHTHRHTVGKQYITFSFVPSLLRLYSDFRQNLMSILLTVALLDFRQSLRLFRDYMGNVMEQLVAPNY